MRVMLAVGIAAVAMAAASPAANGAVTIGATFDPADTCPGGICNANRCDGGTSVFTSAFPAPPAASHAAPAAGVITSWSFQASADAPGSMRVKVARGTPTALTTIGRSELQAIVASQINTFPTRIPVQAGDVIGHFATDGGQYECGRADVGYTRSEFVGDPAPGSANAYAIESIVMAMSAQLEPDADGDGFGDETQDQCSSQGTTQGPCIPPDTTVPPDTTITKSPAKKTTKKKATFGFTSTKAGSTFTCQLDEKPAAPCTSPKTFKVKVGKHTFTVFSTDAAGNKDATAATYKWRRKQPR